MASRCFENSWDGHESERPEVEIFGRRLSTDYEQVHQGPCSMLKANRCACCSREPGWFKKARRIRRSSYSLYARQAVVSDIRKK